jgi:hypothetical protein
VCFVTNFLLFETQRIQRLPFTFKSKAPAVLELSAGRMNLTNVSRLAHFDNQRSHWFASSQTSLTTGSR